MQSYDVGDLKLRVMSKKVDSGYTIKAAFDESRIYQKVNDLIQLFFILGSVGVFIIGLMNRVFIKRSLTPIHLISEKVRIYSSSNLSERLDVINKHDEIGELSSVLNQLLDRLDSSFRSLKQFTSDASHELRTPLTAIKSLCDVSLNRDQSLSSYKDTVESVSEEVRKMTDLVDSLLTLARGDSGLFQPNFEKININEKIIEVESLLSILAEEKNQKIIIESSDVFVIADPVLIRQAFMGLLHLSLIHI